MALKKEGRQDFLANEIFRVGPSSVSDKRSGCGASKVLAQKKSGQETLLKRGAVVRHLLLPAVELFCLVQLLVNLLCPAAYRMGDVDPLRHEP